jgi:uncharacterized damage-inducible protein DinB
MKKSMLIKRILMTRSELEGLIEELGPDRLIYAGVAGEWSVKDMLVHIAWYQREETELFGETGRQASPLWNMPQDARNEILFAQNRNRPLGEILHEFRMVFNRFLDVVDRLSNEEINSPGRFPGTTVERPPWRAIAIHTYEHDREHIDMITAWMKQITIGGSSRSEML